MGLKARVPETLYVQFRRGSFFPNLIAHLR